jgi:hypothetical protein
VVTQQRVVICDIPYDAGWEVRGWKLVQRLRLGSGGTHMKALYEIVSMKLAKQIAGSYVAFRKIKDWTLWRGRPPPKQLKSNWHT